MTCHNSVDLFSKKVLILPPKPNILTLQFKTEEKNMINTEKFVAKKGNPVLYKGFWWFDVEGVGTVQIFGTWKQAESIILSSYPSKNVTLLVK